MRCLHRHNYYFTISCFVFRNSINLCNNLDCFVHWLLSISLHLLFTCKYIPHMLLKRLLFPAFWLPDLFPFVSCCQIPHPYCFLLSLNLEASTPVIREPIIISNVASICDWSKCNCHTHSSMEPKHDFATVKLPSEKSYKYSNIAFWEISNAGDVRAGGYPCTQEWRRIAVKWIISI